VADGGMKVLWLLHGANLDMLGRRDPKLYGSETLTQLEQRVARHAERRGFEVQAYQTNFEGEFIELLHEIAVTGGDAVIVNPGAWTHYSYAIRDALELVPCPVAEVHLSAIAERETWRRTSVIADLAAVRVAGKGVDGYLEAVDRLAELMGDEPASRPVDELEKEDR
jgi:3-dehydroquinate dehydratase-2